jgi:adenylate cyclase
MAIEIERKFLVNNDDWKRSGQIVRKKAIEQWYLNTDPRCTVRVRTRPDMTELNVLCIKGKSVGMSRGEIEKNVTVAEANQLLEMREEGTITVTKTRFELEIDGILWELDSFHGANDGLVMVEVELTSEDQEIIIPSWVGKEVTTDHRYSNSMLAKRPYTTWDTTKYESPLL